MYATVNLRSDIEDKYDADDLKAQGENGPPHIIRYLGSLITPFRAAAHIVHSCATTPPDIALKAYTVVVTPDTEDAAISTEYFERFKEKFVEQCSSDETCRAKCSGRPQGHSGQTQDKYSCRGDIDKPRLRRSARVRCRCRRNTHARLPPYYPSLIVSRLGLARDAASVVGSWLDCLNPGAVLGHRRGLCCAERMPLSFLGRLRTACPGRSYAQYGSNYWPFCIIPSNPPK
ncbi:hypothetical protein L226DRAFT_270164 [Lentinus tigrinus ALCF2SS1-7]|uniref:Uncharacterized protein n=1 Tax=Lentinus tigrinus ALCF2SS1-6 TaxID=1328759 RepID=A0A5C2RRH9_9APHY|nr:hypothetical protein L227DRAFT_422835 [Lentinus tigrinus ALCF2SS1-6]RPD69668.1 hypothetical protein L226DRAFT_270164 [Lentinus tigrinus ALCF2SS1-7]